jgi:hypothetical protein
LTRSATQEGDQPSLEDLAPLYQAIAHGCQASRHQDALDEIYKDRICRRLPDGALENYASRTLGALSTELAAISWFFARPYEIPVAALKNGDPPLVLSHAGFYLRAHGRLGEARTALRRALHKYENDKIDDMAAIRGSQVSEVELLIGDIAAAVETAEKSVDRANITRIKFQMSLRRAYLADALNAAGKREESERLFADAEALQTDRVPLLSSLQGYQYCDLLLAKGDHAAARDRAIKTINVAHKGSLIRDIGLDELTLGRAHLALALENAAPQRLDATASQDVCTAAYTHFDNAVAGLRKFGEFAYIARGHLARAAFRRSIGDWDSVARDLDEVQEIADTKPLPMKLFLCDMALERARLAFAKIEAFAPLNGLIDDSPPKPVTPDAAETARLKEEAANQLAIVADYIKTCGYHRRDEELAELQAVLRGERKFADLLPRV